MKKYSRIIILVNLMLLLIYFNYSVFQKEMLLSKGQLILLELAPVDPRSLMQGDYMSLQYALTNDIDFEQVTKRGFYVVKLEESGVAKKVRIQEGKMPVSDHEYLIEYSSGPYGNINIGAESFFFQEGDGHKYEKAEYGGLKVDDQGNSLLIGLYDENQIKIE